MNMLEAFAMGEQNRHRPHMVFDWDKAARMIVEHKPERAYAGLAGDWNWTGGLIWDGHPVSDSYTYLASTWATPQLLVEEAYYDCYVMENETEWDSDTKWPASAIRIVMCDHECKDHDA